MTFRTKLAAAAALLPAVAAVAAPAGAPTAAAKLLPIDAAGLKRQIAARKGKVVVVNFWATWCGPCKEEFPDLVKLQNAHKAKGMDLVTVSFDDTADVPTKVTPFLRQNRLATGTFINKTGTSLDDSYLKSLEPKLPPDEAFSLPRTYVFDRKGTLVKTLVGGQSYADFQKAVAPLLARK
jgi:thiol-disulfide isomerase/thioredoxin